MYVGVVSVLGNIPWALSTPCLTKPSPVQPDFEMTRAEASTTSLGNLCQCLNSQRCVFPYWDGTWWVLICAHCLFSQWTVLRRVQLSLHSPSPGFIHLDKILSWSDSQGWAVPVLSASSHRKDASVLWPYLCPCIGLVPVKSTPLSYPGAQNWTQPSICDQGWAERKDHLPQTAGSVLPNAPQGVVGLLCHEGV